LTKQEVIADSWIFLFAGHETSGNTTHFALLFLAIALDAQAHLQSDIETIVGARPPNTWTYETDMGRLYLSMVGATMNETLRLMPPIIDIPKIVRGAPQPLTFDGKAVTVPTNTFIHLSAAGVHRNPRYWPNSPSKVTNKAHDLDDFVPQRWLPASRKSTDKSTKLQESSDASDADGLENAYFESGEGLFVPTRGAYIPFSEGARSCPGRRFAQVEITAVLAAIFQTYSVELDVCEWASDTDVDRMGKAERKVLYEKAKSRARKLVFASKVIITLQMKGTHVPVRFVKRGEERFMDCYTS
jgi:cytochrome P450